MGRIVRRLKRATKRAANSAVGAGAIGLLKLLRLTNPDTMRNIAGRFMRTVGPLLPENRIGRANLTAAFPEKSTTEIDTILRGVWDNLGRIAAEFAHLDRLSDFDPWHPERAEPYRSETRQTWIVFLNCWSSQSRRSSLVHILAIGNSPPSAPRHANLIPPSSTGDRTTPRSTNGCMRRGLRRWECLSRPVSTPQ